MSIELSYVNNFPWSIIPQSLEERFDPFQIFPKRIIQLPELELCLDCQELCQFDRFYGECPERHFEQGFNCGCKHGSCRNWVHCVKTVEE